MCPESQSTTSENVYVGDMAYVAAEYFEQNPEANKDLTKDK